MIPHQPEAQVSELSPTLARRASVNANRVLYK